jgi:GTP cyclohydrolase II
MEKRSLTTRAPIFKTDKPIKVRCRVRIPTTIGARRSVPIDWVTFEGLTDQKEHVALVVSPAPAVTSVPGVARAVTSVPAVMAPTVTSVPAVVAVPTVTSVPLVRMHSECLTGDVFESERCDCGAQLREALGQMADAGGGILLYLRQEGRGIGLYNKLDAYELQDLGVDTFEANRLLNFPSDGRDYRCAAEMLRALGVTSVRLISNNPDKAAQLARWGIRIESIVNTSANVTHHNRRYLEAKVRSHGHTIDLPPALGVD